MENFECFADVLKHVEEKKNSTHEVWFRGQSKASYKLSPSLFRLNLGRSTNDYRKFEENSYKKFEEKCAVKILIYP